MWPPEETINMSYDEYQHWQQHYSRCLICGHMRYYHSPQGDRCLVPECMCKEYNNA